MNHQNKNKNYHHKHLLNSNDLTQKRNKLENKELAYLRFSGLVQHDHFMQVLHSLTHNVLEERRLEQITHILETTTTTCIGYREMFMLCAQSTAKVISPPKQNSSLKLQVNTF